MPCCPAGAQEIPPVRIRGSVVPVHCPPIRNAPLSQNVCESYSDCSGTPQTAGHTDLHLYRRLAPVWRLPPAGGATHQDCVRPPDCIGFQCQYGEECFGTVSANHVHRCAARLLHSDSPSSAGPSGPIPISPLTVSCRQHSDLQCMGLTGTMASSISLIRLGRFHMRPFQRWVLSLRIPPSQGRRQVIVTNDAVSALRPWRTARFLTQGVEIGLVPSRLVITTNASLQGWGATFQGRSASGLWEGDLLAAHINFLELMAVRLALIHFLPWIRQQHVLVMTDNLTTKYYINKQGGLRSDRLNDLARQLTLWSVENLASLRSEYVPGLLNCGADLLSRGQARYDDWSLLPEVAEMIWSRFGSPVADLFATEENTKYPLFFAIRGRSTLGNDALSGVWPQGLLYAFPPLTLIPPLLARIRTTGARMLLVAPGWGAWVSDIIPLLYDEPWSWPAEVESGSGEERRKGDPGARHPTG